MSTFFGVLGSLSFLGFCIGLVSPRLMHMSRRKTVAIFLSGSFVFFILYAVTAPPEAQTLVTVAPVDATSTPQGQIEEIVDNAAPGMTNDTNEYHLRSVKVTQDPQGGWDVAAEINGDDNVTENLTKQSMEEQMSKIYLALYTSKLNIATASVEGFLQLTDKYGNTKDSMVYESTLDKTTAAQVNWSADSTVLELNILPGVWNPDYDMFSADPNL